MIKVGFIFFLKSVKKMMYEEKVMQKKKKKTTEGIRVQRYQNTNRKQPKGYGRVHCTLKIGNESLVLEV